jgi:cell division protein FtsQ
VLAHNSVDRGLMARDSIELNLDEQTPSPGKPSRALKSSQRPALSGQLNLDDRAQRSRAMARERGDRRPMHGVSTLADDSELLIDPEDLDLEDLDDEEVRFLRADRRVPVRRGALPKRVLYQFKIAGVIALAVLLCGGLAGWAYSYGLHAARFTIPSSDAVEVSGVHNATRAQVMEVAAHDVGRNVFYVPLDERRIQLEQIPWVEQATVMRLLPNRLAVTIRERTPVAFVQIGSRVSLIDANGVVMGMPANRQTRYSFPVIRGITETDPLSSRAAAMKIYNRLVGELGSGDADNAKAVNYVRQLSEVDLSDPEDVKITANDPGGTMVVHLGPTDFLSHYKLYVAHIAEWRQQFPNLQSVDLRFEGQVVVNPDKPDREIGRSGDRVIRKAAPIKAATKPVSHKVVKPKKHPPQGAQRTQR